MKLLSSLRIFIFFVFFLPQFILASSMDELLVQGVQYYEKGDYGRAQEIFEKMLNDGIQTGGVHYNLGHIHYRQKDLGKSIYHFRSAQELLPRDPDPKFNLEFVRQKTLDRIKDEKSSLFSLLANSLPFNPKESFYILFFSSLIFWVPFIISQFKKMNLWKWLKPFALGLYVFSLLLWTLRYSFSSSFGVIIQKEAKVYSGIGRDNIVLFTLHEGTEFTPLEVAEEEWVKILLSDGKKGWIKKESTLLSPF